MHDDFGIGLAGQVTDVVFEQFLLELHVVRQLAVEGKAEPLVFLQMVPFKRLCVAAVVCSAGGIADVADGRPARVFPHHCLCFGPMGEAEDLADAAGFFVGVDQLGLVRMVARQARGKLAPVLDVEQHPRH